MSKTRPLGRTSIVVFALVCVAVLLGAASAQADTFCVGPADMTGCPSGTTPDGTSDLQAAIDATISNSASSSDSIYIAPGTYASASGWSTGASKVKLIGVGASKPVLTIAALGALAGQTVLKTTGSLVTYDNLSIVVPAVSNDIGISDASGGGIQIANVDVTGPGSTNAMGISLSSAAPQVKNVSINLPHATTGNDSVGLIAMTATSIAVNDTTIAARTGITLSHLQAAKIQRVAIHAPQGIQLIDAPASVISSSLIAPSSSADGETNGFSVASLVDDGNSLTAPLISNSTLIGAAGTSSTGIVSSVPIGAGTSAIDVDSTVIFGHDTAVSTSSGSGSALVHATYSRYAGPVDAGFTAGAATAQISGDPGFTNAGGGDFTLQRSSSLVDAGNPGAIPGDASQNDLTGAPRVVSRGGGNVRDIGAYELQNRAPEARITIATAVPTTTSPIVFSAASSADADGDAMSYAWKFDSASFMSGQVVNKQITTEGPHSVQLTVTDSTGVSASTSRQFTVAKGFLALKLRSQNVTADSRGGFSITMTCPDGAASNCTGRLVFQTVKKIEAKNYQDAPRKGSAAKAKILRAANYVYSIEPGTTRKLRIQTYGTFQNVLKKNKKFTLAATMLNGSTSNATLVSNSPRFVLSAPKAKKKR